MTSSPLMPDQSSKSPDVSEKETEQTPAPALWLQLSLILRAFWNSPERNKVVLLVAGSFQFTVCKFGVPGPANR